VIYRIEEGEQLRVGTVRIEGNEHVDAAKLAPELNTARALLSPRNLAGDRDTLLTDYLSRGFDHVRVECPSRLRQRCIQSGRGVPYHRRAADFVRKVLLTGLHYTRRTPSPRPSRCIPATRSTRPR